MKKLILLFAALALSAPLQASPLLDDEEQFELLLSIDAICGDTWCEGDSNWSFDAIRCDSETGCVLDLTMMPYEFSDDLTLAERGFSCDLNQFTERSALVERTRRGLQYTTELFEAVGDCIGELNDNFGPMYIPVDTACRSLFAKEDPVEHTIVLKEDMEGLDAAIWAATRLVRNEAKIVESCRLKTLPYYRDRAYCKKTQAYEICTFPTSEGRFKVRRSLDTGLATVKYLPTQAWVK